MASHRFCQSCLSAWSQFTDLLSLRVCWQLLKIHIWLLAILKCSSTICLVLPRKYFKRMPCTLQNQSFWAFGMLSRMSVSATPRQFGVLQKIVWDHLPEQGLCTRHPAVCPHLVLILVIFKMAPWWQKAGGSDPMIICYIDLFQYLYNWMRFLLVKSHCILWKKVRC